MALLQHTGRRGGGLGPDSTCWPGFIGGGFAHPESAPGAPNAAFLRHLGAAVCGCCWDCSWHRTGGDPLPSASRCSRRHYYLNLLHSALLGARRRGVSGWRCASSSVILNRLRLARVAPGRGVARASLPLRQQHRHRRLLPARGPGDPEGSGLRRHTTALARRRSRHRHRAGREDLEEHFSDISILSDESLRVGDAL